MLFYGIAFAGQMPLGALADKLNRNGLVASAGCISMIAAFVLMYLCDDALYSVTVLGGLGNALVHVGGGIDVLNHSGKKSGPLGIFVSPGAIGLFVGGLLVKNSIEIPYIVCISLALAAAAIPVLQRYSLGSLKSCNVPLSLRIGVASKIYWIALAVASLFIVVCVRSYVGLTLSFDWKTQAFWGVALLVALVLGKSFGGVLSDRFGMMRTAGVSLALSVCLFAFPHVPVAGVLAVFLFNMTMPMTLWALSRIFNHARGFAFGTLTLALFLGFLLTIVHREPLIPMGWGFSIAALLSLVLIVIGIRPVAR